MALQQGFTEDASGNTVVSGTVTTTAVTSVTGTITSVVGSVTSVTLLASNAARKGFSFYSDSASIAYVAFGATASVTSFTMKLQPNSYYENSTLYTGVLSIIWVSAVGAARVTELT